MERSTSGARWLHSIMILGSRWSYWLPGESLGDSCGVAACGLWHAEASAADALTGAHSRRSTPNVEMMPVLLRNSGKVISCYWTAMTSL